MRIIVRKSFKSFVYDGLAVQNGVGGLVIAAKQTPEIILLDITIPVMDGVEMLTKIESDPASKSILVSMLKAEAGRENVMKFAKIGLRDYIGKLFKEDILVNKLS